MISDEFHRFNICPLPTTVSEAGNIVIVWLLYIEVRDYYVTEGVLVCPEDKWLLIY